MGKYILILGLLFWGQVNAGEIYKCNQNDLVIFSDKPCGEGAAVSKYSTDYRELERPSFSIYGNSKLISNIEYQTIWPFPSEPSGYISCVNVDSLRKAVWFNGKNTTYAINGQAMASGQLASKSIYSKIVGKKFLIGREASTNHDGLRMLIDEGLKLCL
ncbi:hypothetical protein FS418_04945 [Shewanella sp. YLB-09]|uniref:DUF4124 domain-containing protein n=1 Tax=Shewanella eurypsychrophilus TaxID=2593656 RepID=A0A550AC62_9GAMM|nr:hypothetical protein FS418_04945 [Shewanella sp. YLB-09]